MNLLDLFVRIGAKDEASKQVEGIGAKIKNGLGSAAKAGMAAMGAMTAAAGAGAVALAKTAIDSYGEFEQLSGGAELMFGNAYDFIIDKSQQAYKTVQMSQNEYLQQVNGFAVGLRESLNGNSQAAAELADKIVTAEADIVAATGNTQENVQNAFNGIMKGNYTMLDNLQIGIKPTKEGMQEVIDKVNEWNAANGEASNYTIENLADVQSALVDYIDMVGMSGYAQEEAAKTLQGSIASVKGAWTNLLTEFAKDDGDVGARMQELVDSVMTVLFGQDGMGGLVPRIQTIVTSVSESIPTFLPQILEALESLTEPLLTAVVEMTPALLEGIMQVITMLSEQLPSMILEILPTIIALTPQLVQTAITFFLGMVQALTTAGPELMSAMSTAITGIINVISQNLPQMLTAAGQFILMLLNAIVDNAPQILASIGQLALDLVNYVIEHAPDMLAAAGEFIMKIGEGISNGVGDAVSAIGSLVQDVINRVGDFSLFSAGGDLISGFIGGIQSMADSALSAARSVVEGAVNGVKSFLGIASPSKLFKQIGEFTMEGLAIGITSKAREAEIAMAAAMAGITGAAYGSVAMRGGIASVPYGMVGAGDTYNVTLVVENGEDANAMAMQFTEAIRTRSRLSGRASTLNTRLV